MLISVRVTVTTPGRTSLTSSETSKSTTPIRSAATASLLLTGADWLPATGGPVVGAGSLLLHAAMTRKRAQDAAMSHNPKLDLADRIATGYSCGHPTLEGNGVCSLAVWVTHNSQSVDCIGPRFPERNEPDARGEVKCLLPSSWSS
jgi:hypothetical protein